MYWKCQPKVIVIKESQDLITLDISTLWSKLKEYENELRRLEVSGDNATLWRDYSFSSMEL